MKRRSVSGPRAILKRRSVSGPRAILKRRRVSGPRAILKRRSVSGPQAILKRRSVSGPPAILKRRSVSGPQAILKHRSVSGPRAILKRRSVSGPRAILKRRRRESTRAHGVSRGYSALIRSSPVGAKHESGLLSPLRGFDHSPSETLGLRRGLRYFRALRKGRLRLALAEHPPGRSRFARRQRRSWFTMCST